MKNLDGEKWMLPGNDGCNIMDNIQNYLFENNTYM